MQMTQISADGPAAAWVPTWIDATVAVGHRKLRFRILMPTGQVRADLPPLLALHGIARDAQAIEAAFGPACEAAGRVLIVPRFSETDWPHFQTIGVHRPDKAILAALSHVADLRLARTDRVAVFGYSGGAQLAHRFAMLYPNRVARLHLAAAGWYCLPDQSLPFPMGLGPGDTPRGVDVAGLSFGQLPTFLKLPIRVYVGAEDTARDPALRRHPLLESAQGRNRRTRAHSYAKACIAAAEARGIAPDVQLDEIPGCAHSFTACAQAGMTDLVCLR